MDTRFGVVFLAVVSAVLVAKVNAQMGLMGGVYSHEMIQRCQGMIQQFPSSFTFPGMGGFGYGGMGMGGAFGVGVPYYGYRNSDGQEVNADPAATGEPGAPGAPAS